MKDYNEVAKSWIEGNFDPETKCQVLALRNTDPTGFEDAFYKSLEFGTGGLRGIMGVGTNRMNKYTVGMATQGLANYINAHVEGAKSVWAKVKTFVDENRQLVTVVAGVVGGLVVLCTVLKLLTKKKK